MNKTFLAFLTTTLISTAAIAEIDPNEAILNGLNGAGSKTDFREVVKKAVKLEPAAGKAKPVARKVTKKAAKKAPPKRKKVAKKSGRKATTWFSGKKDGQRMSLTFTSRPKYTRKINGNKIKLTFTAPVDYVAPKIPKKFKQGFESLSKISKDGKNLVVEVVVSPDYNFKVNHNNSRVFVDLTAKDGAKIAKADKKAKTAKAEPKKSLRERLRESGVEIINADNAEIGQEQETSAKFDANSKGIERLMFDFPKANKAAMFQKLGNFWIVFDVESEMKAPKGIAKSKIFEKFEVVGTKPLVIKLPLKQRAFASVDKIGTRWEMEFDTALQYEVEKPLQVFENKEYIAINSSQAGDAIAVKDDLFGEEFKVIPLEASGEAVAKEVAKKEVIFEPTVQGIVYREVNEYADIVANESGLKIFKLPQESQNIVAQKKKILFDFKKWHQLESKDFAARKKTVIRNSRYEYAKFLFSQKLYTEAAVILKGLKGYKANFLGGASYFMEGRPGLALEAFNKVNLPFDVDESELLMWQIAANQKIEQTRPYLVQDVEFTEGFEVPENLNNYPGDIAAELILALAERVGNEGNIEQARNYLNLMPKTAQVRQYLYKKYLTAVFDNKEGKKLRAREAWLKLTEKTTDDKVRARAFYSIAKQNYELEKIDRKGLIEDLDEHRIIWRGDNFEYHLLTELAGLRYEEGQKSLALRNYKEAIKAFPKHPENAEVSKEMRKIYEETILQDFSDSEKTYEALATYYEFEELKPVGEQGDRMTLELAEKLVDLDLLDDAAKVLRRYSKKVTDKEERVLVMTRVAILNYLNNDTKAALRMLSKSRMRNMPKYLEQEREILRAEIYIKAKAYDNAKLLLPRIKNGKAKEFETKILWLEQDWEGLVAAYKGSINLTDEDVIRLTVAYALTGKEDKLLMMKDKYQNRMLQGRHAKSFAFVTGDNVLDYRNLAESLDIGLAKDTVSSYRDRLNFGDLKKNHKVNG